MTDPKTPAANLPSVPSADEASGRVTRAILDFVSHIPHSKQLPEADPQRQAKKLASAAARKAALTAGGLALPPGPLGWLTVLPELISIWKIQAQLISDIAAAYGKTAELGREQMLWCLFRHTSAQAFRDVVVRLGDRLIFRRVSFSAIERITRHIGMKVTQRALSEGVSRWLPLVGAIGVGGYAYYDTRQVAETTIALMESELVDEADTTPVRGHAREISAPQD